MPRHSPNLHIGCGSTILPDHVNLDIVAGPGVDVAFDLDRCRDTPLPFPDDHFDTMRMAHVLEHLNEPLAVMQELYRVARPGCRLFIEVPHGGHDDAWVDPTHRRAYFPKSFEYFSQPKYYGFDYGYQGDWSLVSCDLFVNATLFSRHKVERLRELIEFNRNIAKVMRANLVAVKPGRPRERRLMDRVVPSIHPL
ncbi:class I SAM-dependent methyltransferase [Azospirillum halopraeferens]|uniref:class I SAM-dependent methyltransferase n=1 Tax=Azospirillum halopraeferens TaxID=34010 RepID=UPI0003FDD72F|nr:methyltransferase domain-containing protein [Azospirillum halopraeferens]